MFEALFYILYVDCTFSFIIFKRELMFKIFFIYLAVPGLSCGTWDLVPDQGSNPDPLHWEHGVLATGPPGKSQIVLFNPPTSICLKHITRKNKLFSPKY